MKKILLTSIFAISLSIIAHSQCSDPYAGQDTAFCGYTAELSVENATTGYWTAFTLEGDNTPAIDFFPSATNENIGITISGIDGYSQVIGFVWIDNSGPCNDTVLVEFLEEPNAYAGQDFEVCGSCADLIAVGEAMSMSWLPEGSSYMDYEAPQTEVCVASYGDLAFTWIISNSSIIASTSCSDSDEVTITFWREPSANILTDISDTIFNCGLVYLSLEAENPGANITGAWVANDVFALVAGTNIFDTVVDVMVTDFGLVDFYWVEQSGPSELNCRDTAGPANIYFAAEPNIFAGEDDSIFGTEYVLTGISNNSNIANYAINTIWQNNVAVFSNPENDTTQVIVPDYGEYEFIVSSFYEENPSCSSSDTVKILFEDLSFQWSILVNTNFDLDELMPNHNDVTVYLYQQVPGKNEVEYNLHSYLQPESNGQIIFNNLSSGNYFLKSSISNTEEYPHLFENIYYTNSLDIDNATPITISDESVFIANLNHQLSEEVIGNNTADGYVGYLDSKSITGVPEQIVVLYNADIDETIDISTTNQDGYYFFENVPDYTNIELFVSSFNNPQHSSFEIFTNESVNYSASFILDGGLVYPLEESGITISEVDSFEIYPNPTNSLLNINSELQITDISISDINGRIVLSQKDNHNTIDVSSLESGVYFIKVSTRNGDFNKKFVKQ